jgi:hypothetical protein
MVLLGLIGAALCGFDWACALPAKPLATYLGIQARVIGYGLILFALAGAMGTGRLLRRLREPLYLVPFYLVQQIPPIVAMTVGWEGGWLRGIAGAAVGAAAGASAGWLMARWALPEIEKRGPGRRRAILLPTGFAALFAFFGAYNWGVEWVTPAHAWAIGVLWVGLAIPGALVGRPLLGLLVMSPLVLVTAIPLVATLTVGWAGGWICGIAGAAVAAAAGAVQGWAFNRWIMPEYDKRRAHEARLRPPASTHGQRPSGPMAERA